jgi:excisionase family DNA binding protein
MADLLTTGQVQDLLQVDRTTIYRMVEDGRLPAIRVGKQWRFGKDEIERWLQERASPMATALAASPVANQAPTELTVGPSATPHLSEILPLACVQLMQDVFAEMLGVMLVITDMQGQPITQISNPCAFFVAATQNAGGTSACTRTWQGLAESISLEPTYIASEVGLLCARGLIRLRSELKGMVILGGIAPATWPPDAEQLAAIARNLCVEPAVLEAKVNAVYRLDKAQSEKTLRFAQRIADTFSHIVEDRSLIQSKLQAIASLATL